MARNVQPVVPVNCLKFFELITDESGGVEIFKIIFMKLILVSTLFFILQDPSFKERLEHVFSFFQSLVHESLEIPQEVETLLIRNFRERTIGVSSIEFRVERRIA